MQTTRLLSLGTAVPPYIASQAEVVAQAAEVFRDKPALFERLRPAFDNAGIAQRHLVRPPAWIAQPRDWAEMNAVFLPEALQLLEQTCAATLEPAGVAAEEVDVLVTACSTGFTTPSLDARLLERVGFRRDVERLPLVGLGCAGGVLGLARAASLARARPGAKVLFLTVELCSLTFRSRDKSSENVIAAVLFGDGAAGALLCCEAGGDTEGVRIGPAGEHTWPDSLDVMGWRIEPDGLGVFFSQSIPQRARVDLPPLVDAFLGQHGLARSDIDGYAPHPGGAKVLQGMREGFALEAADLAASAAVLRDYGNMSAPTALFVLQRQLASGAQGRQLMMAMGPGFTAAYLLIEDAGRWAP